MTNNTPLSQTTGDTVTDAPYPPMPPVPPQQGPAPYVPQQPAGPYVQTMPKVDGLAIASLVLGILWIWWIGSILAMIFGAVALRRINQSNGWRTGRGMAIAGLVLGLVGGATFLLIFLSAMAGS